MNKSTIKTIRYALLFLKSINFSISILTNSPSRLEQAEKDIRRDDDAILDFEIFVKNNHLED